jgi:hypothetical protein
MKIGVLNKVLLLACQCRKEFLEDYLQSKKYLNPELIFSCKCSFDMTKGKHISIIQLLFETLGDVFMQKRKPVVLCLFILPFFCSSEAP